MDKPVANMVLAPCPFCGGDADIHFDDDTASFDLGCTVDGCAAVLMWVGEDIEYLADAVASWNRRFSPQPSLEGEVETRLLDLIGRYWDLAWSEGRRGVSSDTKDGAAQGVLSSITAEVRALSADNARLREERDAMAKVIDPDDNRPALMARIIMASVERLVRAEAAEARLSEAVEVLKPFAKCSEVYPAARGMGNVGFAGLHDNRCPLTFDDYHRARQFLDTQGGGNG